MTGCGPRKRHGQRRLIVDPKQFQGLLQADSEAFVGLVHEHLIEALPDEIRGIPAPLVRSMIEVGIARARSHGLRSDEELLGFVAVMFEVAPNFDEEEELRAVLTRRGPSASDRWEALFADTPALRLAWEYAAQPQFYDPDAWLPPTDRPVRR